MPIYVDLEHWFQYIKYFQNHNMMMTTMMTTWWPIDDHLVTNWWSLGDHLVTTWWPLGDLLVTSWWPLGDHLVTTWWPLGDHLVTTWWQTHHFSIKGLQVSVWKMQNPHSLLPLVFWGFGFYVADKYLMTILILGSEMLLGASHISCSGVIWKGFWRQVWSGFKRGQTCEKHFDAGQILSPTSNVWSIK